MSTGLVGILIAGTIAGWVLPCNDRTGKHILPPGRRKR
jgi:hypothetical protein